MNDDKRQGHHLARVQVADLESVRERFKQGCTLQVHQPQRFSDPLWRLCAALEARLGCLVGCNAYMLTAEGESTL